MSMKKKISMVLVTTILLFLSHYIEKSYSGDQNLCQLLPEELLKLAINKGFDQVNDFYENRPGMLNPPYVYGYLTGSQENSAVFWCQKEILGKKTYFLVFMFKDRSNKLCNCPDVIEWRNYPGGLSVYKDTNTKLEYFVYINNPERKVPKNVRLTHNAILSEYDGVEELFYCYNGEWLVRMRD